MNLDILFKEIQQLDEIETEVSWFIRSFAGKDTNFWLDLINDLYLDFDVQLPRKIDKNSYRLPIGLAILVHSIELDQGTIPGTYRLYIEKIGYFDHLEKVRSFCVNTLATLAIFCYQGVQDHDEERPKLILRDRTNKWNSSEFVVQEKVKALADKYPLDIVAEKLDVPVEYLPVILSDYYSRVKKKRLENLEQCLRKADRLFESNPGLQESASFFNFILGEVKNGGMNLNSPDDIFPHYSGLKFN